jgi:hypothetical protein
MQMPQQSSRSKSTTAREARWSKSLNRESVDAKLVADAKAARAHGAGAFWFVDGGMMVMLPGDP